MNQEKIIKLTLGQHTQTVSLKETIKNLGSQGNSLKLQLSINPNTTVTVVDDLTTFDDLSNNKKINHTIEFVINENSDFTYQSKIVPSFEKELPAQSDDDSSIEKNLTFTLAGRGAKSQAMCSAYGSSNRSFTFNTLQNHVIGDTTSNITVKSVLDNGSKLTCDGMIRIHKDAQKTSAKLENKNILLSKKARAISIPKLEIEANDVKCAHGAAVSKLNDEHMFYLQSRGIDAVQTRRMLIEAFLD